MVDRVPPRAFFEVVAQLLALFFIAGFFERRSWRNKNLSPVTRLLTGEVLLGLMSLLTVPLVRCQR